MRPLQSHIVQPKIRDYHLSHSILHRLDGNHCLGPLDLPLTLIPWKHILKGSIHTVQSNCGLMVSMLRNSCKMPRFSSQDYTNNAAFCINRGNKPQLDCTVWISPKNVNVSSFYSICNTTCRGHRPLSVTCIPAAWLGNKALPIVPQSYIHTSSPLGKRSIFILQVLMSSFPSPFISFIDAHLSYCIC